MELYCKKHQVYLKPTSLCKHSKRFGCQPGDIETRFSRDGKCEEEADTSSVNTRSGFVLKPEPTPTAVVPFDETQFTQREIEEMFYSQQSLFDRMTNPSYYVYELKQVKDK